ncbi:MAG: hypothetical protein ACR2RF_05365 [Geminicoccaceae bacterium]
MTRAIFAATTLTALVLAAAAITDPYWPNPSYEAHQAIWTLTN